MGILNTTPDSFSDGGEATTLAAAVAKAEALVKDGADIIDVGGQSTRPGAPLVSPDTEMARVIPVIKCVAQGSNPAENHLALSGFAFRFSEWSREVT